MTKFLIAFVVFITLLVGGYFVVQKNFTQKQMPQSIEKITVGWQPQPAFALMYIAGQKGFFKDEGLEVSFKEFPSGKTALDDAFAGNLDIAAVGEAPVVRKVYEGEKVAIISSLYTSTKNTAIIARKDRGINKIQDIKGKKIAVTYGTTGEFFLFSYLVSQGIRLSEVTLVNAEVKDLLNMLKENKVDGVVTLDPSFFQIKKAFPADSLTIFQSDVYTNTSVLAGRRDIVVQKKEAMIRLLQGLTKAENFYKTNNQEALDIVVAKLPTISEETIHGSLENITPALVLNNVLLTLLNREGQWFKDNGIYKTEVPDFRNAIFTDYLKSVKPEAVTLY